MQRRCWSWVKSKMSGLVRNELLWLSRRGCTFHGEGAKKRKKLNECFTCGLGVGQPKRCFYYMNEDLTLKFRKERMGLDRSHVLNGAYAVQIAHLLRYFAPQDLLIIPSDYLLSHTDEIMRKVFDHVGEDANVWMGPDPATNTTMRVIEPV